MIQLLVTGADGQLGSEIRNIAPAYPAYRFTFIDIHEVDLTKVKQLEDFFHTYQPGVIINCAAYTAVDKAEEENELATLLNAEIPARLAKISNHIGALLIHFSSDYVFNGKGNSPYKETDIPDPQSFYGKTKLQGEKAVLSMADKAVIIRTSWLYSVYGKNFVKTILQKAGELKRLRVVSDQLGTPTYASDLTSHLLQLLPVFLSLPHPEIFHYSNEGATNWYDFALKIIEYAGLECEVDAVETKDYLTPAVRPVYSLLDKSKIKTLGISIPEWESSLKICVQQILKNKA